MRPMAVAASAGEGVQWAQWTCPQCLNGVFLKHRKVERVLGARGADDITAAGKKKEVCVKFFAVSYRDVEWLPQRVVEQVAPEALAAWRATVVTTADPQWSLPDRVLAQRRLAARGEAEFLVKWRGQSYGGCTWEPQGQPGLAELIESFHRHPAPSIRAVHVPSDAETMRDGAATLPLHCLPPYLPAAAPEETLEAAEGMEVGGEAAETPLPGCDLDTVNWLLHNCQRRHGCMLGDADRAWGTVQVAALVHTAFMEKVLCEPVLVVAAESQLREWESVLRAVAAPCRVVAYTGDEAARAVARCLDWEPAGDTLDVLLCTPAVAAEDAPLLRQQKWGLGVLDARSDTVGLLHDQFAGCTLGSLQLGATVLLVPISHPPPPRVWRLLAPHVAADGRPLHHAQQAGFTGALRIM